MDLTTDLIVIPTYDERENVGRVLAELLAQARDLHILVVDDSSPDGTADLVRAHPAYGTRVFLLGRPTKDGLGNAYRAGFDWARRHGYGRVVQMDADGSHAPVHVASLLGALEDADIVVGSRYVAGGRTVDWPLHRRLVSRLGNLYVRALLDLPVRDATAGFRAYRSAELAAAVTAGSESNGYCFQVESTWRATRSGLTLAEVPIAFADRTLGTSKMSVGIVAEAMWQVLRWRFAAPRDLHRAPATAR